MGCRLCLASNLLANHFGEDGSRSVYQRTNAYAASFTVECQSSWRLKSTVPTSCATGLPVLGIAHRTCFLGLIRHDPFNVTGLSALAWSHCTSDVFSESNSQQLWEVTGLSVLANWSFWFDWSSWMLVLLAAASELQKKWLRFDLVWKNINPFFRASLISIQYTASWCTRGSVT